jgi:hypothetical protein
MSIFGHLVRRVIEAALAATPFTDSGDDMRFMIMAIAKQDAPPGPPPTPEAFAAMQAYNEKTAKAGMLLAAEGLAPNGVRVRFNHEERVVTDGPFTESKELVAGFMIIKANSLDEAIEWVKRAPNVSADGQGVVEIRKLMDIEDFGEGFTPNEEIAKVKFK